MSFALSTELSWKRTWLPRNQYSVVKTLASTIHAELMSPTWPISNLLSTFYVLAPAPPLQLVGRNWPHRQPWALKKMSFPSRCLSPEMSSRTLRNPSLDLLVALWQRNSELTKIWLKQAIMHWIKEQEAKISHFKSIQRYWNINLPLEALRKSERLHVGVSEQMISSKSSPFYSTENASYSAWTYVAKWEPLWSVAQVSGQLCFWKSWYLPKGFLAQYLLKQNYLLHPLKSWSASCRTWFSIWLFFSFCWQMWLELCRMNVLWM